MSKESHIERTANEPRDASLHTLTISSITQITPTIRLFHLQIAPNDTIKFLPGQWVDLYPPPDAQIPTPGGFTITSSPSLTNPETNPHPYPYIELAIQSPPPNSTPTPENPNPTTYLSQPTPNNLLQTKVQIRIGGAFTFPPSSASASASASDPSSLLPLPLSPLRKVVLAASGMGINPLMSMLSWIAEQQQQQHLNLEVQLLYGVRDPGSRCDILFLERIRGVFEAGLVRGGVRLFLTGATTTTTGEGAEGSGSGEGERGVPVVRRRMVVRDVEEAVGEDKEGAVVYVCGVPGMTDEFVRGLVAPAPEGVGMDERRVLFEKWW